MKGKKLNKPKVLESAITVFGRLAQEDMAIEEMSELTKALLKYRRKQTNLNYDNVREEIADVKIMIAQLEMMYGNVYDIVNQKIKRLADLLKAQDLDWNKKEQILNELYKEADINELFTHNKSRS